VLMGDFPADESAPNPAARRGRPYLVK